MDESRRSSSSEQCMIARKGVSRFTHVCVRVRVFALMTLIHMILCFLMTFRH